jgi:hypothetical protein
MKTSGAARPPTPIAVTQTVSLRGIPSGREVKENIVATDLSTHIGAFVQSY